MVLVRLFHPFLKMFWFLRVGATSSFLVQFGYKLPKRNSLITTTKLEYVMIEKITVDYDKKI
jgi:hypothetical protein